MTTLPSRSPLYYYSNGERIPLVQAADVYAVKYQPGKTSRDVSFSRQTYRFLKQDSHPIDFIPTYGLHIYQTAQKTNPEERTTSVLAGKSIARSVQDLNQESDVEFAAMAYRRLSSTASATAKSLYP